MKERILTSLLAVIFSVAILSAANPKTTIYTNIIQTETGSIKESILLDINTLKPIQKNVYTYDANGTIQQRESYKWNSVYAWVGIQKYTYQYNNNPKNIANLIHTSWDTNTDTWSTTEYLVQIYDQNEKLFTTQHITANESGNYENK